MRSLHEYQAVLHKVDAKFAEIQGKHAARMQCGAGCHACCLPGLTVCGVERDHLLQHIDATPGLQERLEQLQAQNPHGGTRCSMLDADGRCLVYAARPLVCRSHGVPLHVEAGRLDACPLNFTDLPLAQLDAADRIDLQTLNLLLAVVQRRYDASGAERRFALTIDGLRAQTGDANCNDPGS